MPEIRTIFKLFLHNQKFEVAQVYEENHIIRQAKHSIRSIIAFRGDT